MADAFVATSHAAVCLKVPMRTRALCCLFMLLLSASCASASHHTATLTVVSSVTEDVTAPSGVAWTGPAGSATPGSNSPPSQPISPGEGGSAGQSRVSDPGVSTATKVKGTTVRAFLTTVSGEIFDISMVCYRAYGSCPEPKAGTDYAVELNDDPKYLAIYGKRKAFGFIAVKFSPDGKKKVSYDIMFAMKAGSQQTHPD